MIIGYDEHLETLKEKWALREENQTLRGKIEKAMIYIEELDELESKVDDYAISKYVRNELLDILGGDVDDE